MGAENYRETPLPDREKKDKDMTTHIAFRTTPLVRAGVALGIAFLGIYGLFNAGCGKNASKAQVAAEASQEPLPDPAAGQPRQGPSGNGKATGHLGNPGTMTGALDKAKILCNQGQHELATYHYLNAINADPKNGRLLFEYGKLVEQIVAAKEKEGKRSEAAELLEKLAALFYGQALQVQWESVEAVVAKATEYQKWAEKLQQEEYTATTSGGDSQKLQGLKQRLLAGEALEVPTDRQIAEEQLRDWEAVARMNAAPEDGQAIERLEDHLKALQAVLAFHRGKEIINEYLNLAKGETSPTLSAMTLQQAELALRELAAIKALLPPKLANEVTDLVQQLNDAGVEASKRQAKESSQKAWQEFLKENAIDSRVAAIKNWAPPSEVAEDRACTNKLEELEALMSKIQEMIPLLGDSETREKAMDLLKELGKEAERISKARQNRYCRWALERIKSALTIYERNSTVLGDNEVAFGEALIEKLGPIDESLLPFETRRCYSEVFETIFGELGKVKSTDLQTKGTKMYVLKGMLEKEKKTYRDF